MSAGGFVYESETATYDSTTFSQRIYWALHVFRKQIYAFLHASTRSAQVNGDDHQYWDFDTTRWGNGGESGYFMDNGSDPIHSNEDWNSISENLSTSIYKPNDLKCIYNIKDTDYPGLVCYFVGRGGEHLAFTNYNKFIFSGSYGLYRPNNVTNFNYSIKNMPVGFAVMLSPYEDFNGVITNSANDTSCQSSCLQMIGEKVVQTGSATSSQTTIIQNAAEGSSYTFGFAVKGPKVIMLVTSPIFDGSGSPKRKYLYLLFGDIYTQCQEGDTKTYGGICGYDTGENENGALTSSFGRVLANAAVALSSTGTRMCQYYSSSSDLPLSTNCDIQLGFPVGHSSALSDGIPYTSIVVSFYQNSSGDVQSNTLIKDGNGYKGIVDPDMLRIVPSTVPVGTLESGKFIIPRKTTTTESWEFCFGWDPSNPSTI